MTKRPIIPEPITSGHSAEDFTTSTQRVKAARDQLLSDPGAAAAHRALGQQIEQRLQSKEATLGEVRRALGLTQAQLAEVLGLAQGDVSRLERRRNLYLNTLARFIEATGGRLRVTAIYGDTEVTINLGDTVTDNDPVDELR